MDEQTAKAILEQLKAIAAHTASSTPGKDEYGWLLSSMAQSTAAFLAIAATIFVVRAGRRRDVAMQIDRARERGLRWLYEHHVVPDERPTPEELERLLWQTASSASIPRDERREAIDMASLVRGLLIDYMSTFPERRVGLGAASLGLAGFGLAVPLIMLALPDEELSAERIRVALALFLAACVAFAALLTLGFRSKRPPYPEPLPVEIPEPPKEVPA